MKTELLKSCPFCGSKRLVSYNSMGPSWPDDEVKCRECRGNAPFKVWNMRSKKEAINED